MYRDLAMKLVEKVVQKATTIMLCSAIVIGLSAPAAMAWPWDTKAGDSCKKTGTAKIIAHAPYRCDLNFKKKLIWLPNPAITNKTKALALVYAGCNNNRIDAIHFDWITWVGVAWSYGLKIGWFQDPNFIRQDLSHRIDMGISNYISQTFTVASTLDERWSRILAVWNQSISSVQKSMDPLNGNIANILEDSTRSFSPILESICTLAVDEVNWKASIEGRSEYTWIDRNGDGLIPKSPIHN